MVRINLIVPFAVAVIASAATNAQTAPISQAAPSREPSAKGLLNEDYLTATGATVPRPGFSRAPTLVSRTIRDLERHLEKRICSNC
jgi:hypothetical protein